MFNVDTLTAKVCNIRQDIVNQLSLQLNSIPYSFPGFDIPSCSKLQVFFLGYNRFQLKVIFESVKKSERNKMRSKEVKKNKAPYENLTCVMRGSCAFLSLAMSLASFSRSRSIDSADLITPSASTKLKFTDDNWRLFREDVHSSQIKLVV